MEGSRRFLLHHIYLNGLDGKKSQVSGPSLQNCKTINACANGGCNSFSVLWVQ